MKPRKGSGHWGRNIALVVLLAVLCVGGTELAACRHFAPEVYEQITAPVRAAASAVAGDSPTERRYRPVRVRFRKKNIPRASPRPR